MRQDWISDGPFAYLYGKSYHGIGIEINKSGSWDVNFVINSTSFYVSGLCGKIDDVMLWAEIVFNMTTTSKILGASLSRWGKE